MSSDAQINANRENAKKSTGPSLEGKKRSRMNAATHGYAGQIVVIAEQEVEAYRNHFDSFPHEYRPVGPTETFLVQSMADLSFSTPRGSASCPSAAFISPGPARYTTLTRPTRPKPRTPWLKPSRAANLAPTLNSLGTYEARKMRLFNTTRKELLAIQAERKLGEKEELEDAARLRQADQKIRQPHENEWHASENGFVCSLAEIDRYIFRQNRRDQLLKAA